MARQGVRKMKKIAVLMMMLFLCVSVYPVQDQLQRRFSFSLSGGIIGGKINFAGNIFYAREFEKGLFIQGSGFVLGKEYGTSLGFGLSGENFGIYVFGESLYHQKMFFQIRPAVRLRFPWLSLAASYAVPVGKSTITINGEQVSASKYWGGEVNVVPVDWARIYTEVMSVESVYTRWRVGAEIRPLNWLSVSADWNKTNSGLYSQWTGYQDLRVAVNVSLNGQPSFKLNQKIQMQPQYPVLVAKKKDTTTTTIPFEEKRYTIKVEYIRINVTWPDWMWKGVSVAIADRNTGMPLVNVQQMTRKDDYHFEKQFSEILETESYANTYYIYGIDLARGDGKIADNGKIDDDKAIVGDRFILTVIETGSTLELTNIVQNNLENNPFKGPNAKMAVWRLKRNGTLTNGD